MGQELVLGRPRERAREDEPDAEDEEQQVRAGAGPDVLRLSIGIENADDIILDLDRALSRA